jgi:uncharacterized protein YjbJ (UPF0337 family)
MFDDLWWGMGLRKAIPEGAIVGYDDKVENKTEELRGKAKERLGDATDNEQWQAEGQAEESKGALKQAGEKIKDAFKR